MYGYFEGGSFIIYIYYYIITVSVVNIFLPSLLFISYIWVIMLT